MTSPRHRDNDRDTGHELHTTCNLEDDSFGPIIFLNTGYTTHSCHCHKEPQSRQGQRTAHQTPGCLNSRESYTLHCILMLAFHPQALPTGFHHNYVCPDESCHLPHGHPCSSRRPDQAKQPDTHCGYLRNSLNHFAVFTSEKESGGHPANVESLSKLPALGINQQRVVEVPDDDVTCPGHRDDNADASH
ncbi:hypothetical protein F7725_020491 [Dissostichus mawsoni]|uniref:Uncharacterized protein n=1 Tax=Dissostichus mawsoni TaxID=36200 RepID=A0A7J5YEC5_DISMA|nr:hypothetical protein F7725_020491 [Dissostichus mawsoni]